MIKNCTTTSSDADLPTFSSVILSRNVKDQRAHTEHLNFIYVTIVITALFNLDPPIFVLASNYIYFLILCTFSIIYTIFGLQFMFYFDLQIIII